MECLFPLVVLVVGAFIPHVHLWRDGWWDGQTDGRMESADQGEIKPIRERKGAELLPGLIRLLS